MSVMQAKGFYNRFEDVFILDGLRTPMVDYQGAFADANPIDLGIKAARNLSGKTTVADRDTHPRPTPVDVLAKLRTVFKDGVQTDGNSPALTDAAAAALVGSGAAMKRWMQATGKTALARVTAAAVVGVPPEIMGIGPAPAIPLMLTRSGLQLRDIAHFETNEAQGAQTLAVASDLGQDLTTLNVKGGAIELGHPLAATGMRRTVTVARQLKEIGARWGIASACVGGGQGIALLIENTDAR